MGQPPYAATALHHLMEHLREDPGSAAIQRALVAEANDENSTPERKALATKLLERWQLLVCPDYLSAFYGRPIGRKAS